jgi:hypothetical protein
VATQVPVAEWHARFPDPTIADAVLDRLVHNAYLSYVNRSFHIDCALTTS